MSIESSNDWFSEQPSRLRRLATAATTRVAAGLQTLWGNRCADGFGILLYHRIADEVAGVPAPTLNVTPEQFRAQLSGLLTRGFVAWPLTQLVAAQQAGQMIPSNVFAVTFDDGYENNYRNAWPILRELVSRPRSFWRRNIWTASSRSRSTIGLPAERIRFRRRPGGRSRRASAASCLQTG